MKVFIDTNILVSTALFPKGTAAAAFYRAVLAPNRGIVTDYVIDELRRVFNLKFPEKIGLLEHFLSIALLALEIVPVPVTPIPEEELVRDEKDRPILRAAVAEQVDALLTGDKDLLESGITDPKILRADEFLERAL